MNDTERISTHSEPVTVIVGAGDVVKNRLLPALLKHNMNAKDDSEKITIYDLNCYDKTGRNKGIAELLEDGVEHIGVGRDDFIRSVDELQGMSNKYDDSVAWICTPSNTHWHYLDMLQDKADFYAVEKPMASNLNDLTEFKEYVLSHERSRTFFLSYYMLEKALPLTYLSRPRDLYLKYLVARDDKGKELNVDDSAILIEDFYQKFSDSRARGIKSFEMGILEGKDDRPLAEGGQMVETFIHHCLIASLFFDDIDKWDEPVETRENGDVCIELGNSSSRLHLLLEKAKKNNGKEKQFAVVRFMDGAEITADFKAKSATYSYGPEDDRKSLTIGVSDKYMGKYDVQCDMVYECHNNDIDTSDVDGLYHQVEVLEWMMKKYA